MRKVDSEYLLMALRCHIKRNGLTYGNLAEKMDVPISTLKRHLHSQNITLERLLAYCSELNTTLDELHNEAIALQNENSDIFKPHQDKIFHKYPELYDFFREIKHKQYNINEIKQRYSLDDIDIYRFLRALEIMGLIKLHAENRFTILGPYHYQISEDSQLAKLHFKVLSEQLLSSHDSENRIACSRMTITDEQLEEITENLYKEILRHHSHNINNKNTSKEYHRNIMFLTGQHTPVNFSDGIKPLGHDFLNDVSEIVNNN